MIKNGLGSYIYEAPWAKVTCLSLMMRTEMVLQTSVSVTHLTRLIVREDFIESCCREGFRSCITYIVVIILVKYAVTAT
jgi:hypothetical protein